MLWLKHSVQAGAIMLELDLRVLTGISRFGVAFLHFTLLISFITAITLKYLNENTFGSLKELFIHKMLGWLLYFVIAFSTGSVSSITSVSKFSSFSIFNFLTTLLKTSLKVSATFDFSLKCSCFREVLFWSLSNNFCLKIKNLLSSKRVYYQLSYWCQRIYNISVFKTNKLTP